MSAVFIPMALGDSVSARTAPLDLGFPEWLTFILTVVIIVLAYGIRMARARKGEGQKFMHRTRDEPLSSAPPSQDDDTGFDRDKE